MYNIHMNTNHNFNVFDMSGDTAFLAGRTFVKLDNGTFKKGTFLSAEYGCVNRWGNTETFLNLRVSGGQVEAISFSEAYRHDLIASIKALEPGQFIKISLSEEWQSSDTTKNPFNIYKLQKSDHVNWVYMNKQVRAFLKPRLKMSKSTHNRPATRFV